MLFISYLLIYICYYSSFIYTLFVQIQQLDIAPKVYICKKKFCAKFNRSKQNQKLCRTAAMCRTAKRIRNANENASHHILYYQKRIYKEYINTFEL